MQTSIIVTRGNMVVSVDTLTEEEARQVVLSVLDHPSTAVAVELKCGLKVWFTDRESVKRHMSNPHNY